MSITQLVLIWILSGSLLTWMITFAILAIRPQSRNNVQQEDRLTSSQPLSAISTSSVLHVIVSQPLSSHIGVVSQEPPGSTKAPAT
jgi:preprotein translocase subunit YajC